MLIAVKSAAKFGFIVTKKMFNVSKYAVWHTALKKGKAWTLHSEIRNYILTLQKQHSDVNVHLEQERE